MSRGPNTDYNDFSFERAFIQREEEYRFPELIAELEEIELKCRTTDFVIDKQRGLQPLSIPYQKNELVYLPEMGTTEYDNPNLTYFFGVVTDVDDDGFVTVCYDLTKPFHDSSTMESTDEFLSWFMPPGTDDCLMYMKYYKDGKPLEMQTSLNLLGILETKPMYPMEVFIFENWLQHFDNHTNAMDTFEPIMNPTFTDKTFNA